MPLLFRVLPVFLVWRVTPAPRVKRLVFALITVDVCKGAFISPRLKRGDKQTWGEGQKKKLKYAQRWVGVGSACRPPGRGTDLLQLCNRQEFYRLHRIIRNIANSENEITLDLSCCGTKTPAWDWIWRRVWWIAPKLYNLSFFVAAKFVGEK